MKNGWTGGQYSVFRILLGAYLAVHFVQLMPWAAELFSREGLFAAAASPLFGIVPNVLAGSDTPALATAMLACGALASLFIVAGRHDRVAALVTWYVLACLLGRNPLIANPALPYVGWMLLAHAALPCAPWGSLAARGRADPRGDWRMPSEIFLAAWCVLALSYSYSAYTKLLSPSWVSGIAVELVLQNPLARDTPLREALLALGSEPLRLLTWSILAIELVFAPLALFKRARPVLWGAMFVVQLGFLALLNFADLTAPMLLFHMLTFDPAWIRPRIARRPETIYFDGECGLCHRVVRFVLAEDHAAAFRFAPLQSAQVYVVRAACTDGEGRLLSFAVHADDGRVLTRSTAVLHLLERLGGLWRVVALALRWLPRPVRDACYDGVGAVRARLFARPASLCPIVPADLRARFHA